MKNQTERERESENRNRRRAFCQKFFDSVKSLYRDNNGRERNNSLELVVVSTVGIVGFHCSPVRK